MFFKLINKKLLIFIVIVVSVLAIIALAARKKTTQTLEKEIGALVVETIIEEQITSANRGLQSPEGSVYIQYSSEFFMELGPPSEKISSTPYLSAWKLDNSKIRLAEKQEVINAFNEEVFEVLLSIRSIDEKEAFVDVITSYPNQTGGNGEHWILNFDRNKWVVVKRELFFNWD